MFKAVKKTINNKKKKLQQVSPYFNTYWYLNLTIDGAIYPSQRFPFVAAFVCQAGNFWTLQIPCTVLFRSAYSGAFWCTSHLIRSPLNNLKAGLVALACVRFLEVVCVIVRYEVIEHITVQYASINSENRSQSHMHSWVFEVPTGALVHGIACDVWTQPIHALGR
jgi:hypothetical protein